MNEVGRVGSHVLHDSREKPFGVISKKVFFSNYRDGSRALTWALLQHVIPSLFGDISNIALELGGHALTGQLIVEVLPDLHKQVQVLFLLFKAKRRSVNAVYMFCAYALEAVDEEAFRECHDRQLVFKESLKISSICSLVVFTIDALENGFEDFGLDIVNLSETILAFL